MLTRFTPAIFALILTSSMSFVGQEGAGVGAGQNGAKSPDEFVDEFLRRRRREAEKSKEAYEKAYEEYMRQNDDGRRRRALSALNIGDANVVTLNLARVRMEHDKGAMSAPSGYKKGDKVAFELQATNNSPDILGIVDIGEYYQYRLDLTRDGEAVPYREDVAERIRKIEKSWGSGYSATISAFSVLSYQLEPSETKRIGGIDLGSWYAALEPGAYRLVIKYRPEIGGKWIELPPVSFGVTP